MFLSKDSRDGIYYVIHIVNGKRKRKSLSTKDKYSAQRRFEDWKLTYEAKHSMDNELESQSKVATLKSVSEFVINYAKNNFCASTYQLYLRSFKNLQNIHDPENTYNTITMNDIEYYKTECRKTVCSTSVNMQLRCIKAGFNVAIKYGIVSGNPAKNVKLLNELQKEKLIFDENQIEILLRTIDNIDFKYFVLMGYYTGCRSSEICNLQWGDVDLDRRILTIKNKITFKTKTGKIRKIPISDKLISLLSAKKSICKSDYIFVTRKGNPYNKDLVGRIFRKFIKEANLSKSLHFHCLRHTFITQLLRKGVNIYYVSKLAGHSKISTTMGYIHTDTEDYRTAINLL